MASPWKYLIVLCDNTEVPVIFPANLSHEDVAGRFKVVSAGFCLFDIMRTDRIVRACCFGKSISLGIESRQEDNTVIEQYLQLMFGKD